MKAVILAGGKGKRMGALTTFTPKPLIKVYGKELIRHTLDALPTKVTEYIVVTGYRGEQVKSFLGQNYHSCPIRYVEQESTGTGGALLAAKKHLVNESLFLTIGADDIFDIKGVSNFPTHRPTYAVTYGIPTKPTATGVSFDRNMVLQGRHPSNGNAARYFGVGLYTLPFQIFERPFSTLNNGELSIPHTLHKLPCVVYVHLISSWIPVNTPHELERAEYKMKHK